MMDMDKKPEPLDKAPPPKDKDLPPCDSEQRFPNDDDAEADAEIRRRHCRHNDREDA